MDLCAERLIDASRLVPALLLSHAALDLSEHLQLCKNNYELLLPSTINKPWTCEEDGLVVTDMPQQRESSQVCPRVCFVALQRHVVGERCSRIVTLVGIG